jgi:putative BNR repeat neuraminidase
MGETILSSHQHDEVTRRGFLGRTLTTAAGSALLCASTRAAATAAERPAEPRKLADLLINEKGDGFRGIWYYNQKMPDSEYVYKYSGGLGTYCAKHIPLAWYAPEADKTFFCYGGTDDANSTLYHMVSYYDHATGMVARPTTLLDKKTTDAHDNPVINIDDQGHIWIFSSSHGTGRPSYISRSVKPYDIEEFELVWTGNFSYPQPWFIPGRGFLFLHTYYKGGRGLNTWTSTNGADWTERTLVSHIEMGQYQVSFPCGGKVGTAFNMHPAPKGLNWRTNLYYVQTDDFGATWKTADGTPLEIPLKDAANPALVAEFKSKDRNVYMKDVNYDSNGNPIILVLTSGGYESGPKNDPRTWTTARWTGSEWEIREAFTSDNNYDTGPLYVESDTTWRVIAPTQTGPQPYNPGGEIAIWLTEDAGNTWRMVRQITNDSQFNHTYVRRPVNAQPDFYALWADGHGRQPSKSRLYYCNRDGDAFMLPETMNTPFARARKLP